MKDIKQRAKILFRKLWSNINKENKHLTTEKIEDLIDTIIDLAIKEERDRWLNQTANEHDNQIRKEEHTRIKNIVKEWKDKGFEIDTLIDRLGILELEDLLRYNDK